VAAPGTFKPDAAWMEKQARAFLDHSAREQLSCSIVTRDYDGKFSQAFDQVFKDGSAQLKRVGPQAPNLNAFIERWIQSLQYEALNHFIVFGQEHFDHIVSEYVQYYLDLRPHQSLGNALLPRPRGKPVEPTTHHGECDCELLTLADIKCEQRLGGLLKHFYRNVA
jgi:putative transposase